MNDFWLYNKLDPHNKLVYVSLLNSYRMSLEEFLMQIK